MDNYVKDNEKIWDERSANGDQWSLPVSKEETDKARQGDWKIVLTPSKPIPREWFPEDMNGKKILCLASGGGQQGPILAATGQDGAGQYAGSFHVRERFLRSYRAPVVE